MDPNKPFIVTVDPGEVDKGICILDTRDLSETILENVNIRMFDGMAFEKLQRIDVLLVVPRFIRTHLHSYLQYATYFGIEEQQISVPIIKSIADAFMLTIQLLYPDIIILNVNPKTVKAHLGITVTEKANPTLGKKALYNKRKRDILTCGLVNDNKRIKAAFKKPHYSKKTGKLVWKFHPDALDAAAIAGYIYLYGPQLHAHLLQLQQKRLVPCTGTAILRIEHVTVNPNPLNRTEMYLERTTSKKRKKQVSEDGTGTEKKKRVNKRQKILEDGTVDELQPKKRKRGPNKTKVPVVLTVVDSTAGEAPLSDQSTTMEPVKKRKRGPNKKKVENGSPTTTTLTDVDSSSIQCIEPAKKRKRGPNKKRVTEEDPFKDIIIVMETIVDDSMEPVHESNSIRPVRESDSIGVKMEQPVQESNSIGVRTEPETETFTILFD